MDTQIQRAVDIPGVDRAIVVAYVLDKGDYPRCYWRLDLTSTGPDARYRPSASSLSPYEARRLRDLVEESIPLCLKARDLGERSLYSTALGTVAGIDISLESLGGQAWLKLGHHNPTQWIFFSKVPESDLPLLVASIDKVFAEGSAVLVDLLTVVRGAAGDGREARMRRHRDVYLEVIKSTGRESVHPGEASSLLAIGTGDFGWIKRSGWHHPLAGLHTIDPEEIRHARTLGDLAERYAGAVCLHDDNSECDLLEDMPAAIEETFSLERDREIALDRQKSSSTFDGWYSCGIIAIMILVTLAAGAVGLWSPA